MHILLIHQAFAAIDEPGGTRHHEFARLLAEKGHRITIIASPISYLTGEKVSRRKVEEDAGGLIRIFRTYTYPALHKSFFHRILSFVSFMISSFLRALKIKGVNIIWGTSPPIFQTITAWLVSRIKGKPFLLEVRDLWPAFAVAVGVLKNRLLIILSLFLEKFLYEHADRIIVNSPGFIQHVQKKGGEQITIIPNGSDVSLFENIETQDIRTKFGWGDQFIILYAGAHGMSNDLGVVIRAAKSLERIEEIRFILLGDGKEKLNLIKLANELDVSNLEFRDPVPKNEVAEIITASNACIAILKPIDLFKTTYPNKVFDYMAAAKPVILAIDGVIRKVVEDARCGVYCEPGNPEALARAAAELYKHPNNTAEMGKSGKSYLKDYFNRKEIAARFADMIEEMGLKNG